MATTPRARSHGNVIPSSSSVFDGNWDSRHHVGGANGSANGPLVDVMTVSRVNMASNAHSHTAEKVTGRSKHSRRGSALARRQWTDIETTLLAALHAKHGNQWAVIARHFRLRSDNDVKNIFHSSIRCKFQLDGQTASESAGPEMQDLQDCCDAPLPTDGAAAARDRPNRHLLLRAYAQAVGGNCIDAGLRKAALEAARAQLRVQQQLLLLQQLKQQEQQQGQQPQQAQQQTAAMALAAASGLKKKQRRHQQQQQQQQQQQVSVTPANHDSAAIPATHRPADGGAGGCWVAAGDGGAVQSGRGDTAAAGQQLPSPPSPLAAVRQTATQQLQQAPAASRSRRGSAHGGVRCDGFERTGSATVECGSAPVAPSGAGALPPPPPPAQPQPQSQLLRQLRALAEAAAQGNAAAPAAHCGGWFRGGGGAGGGDGQASYHSAAAWQGMSAGPHGTRDNGGCAGGFDSGSSGAAAGAAASSGGAKNTWPFSPPVSPTTWANTACPYVQQEQEQQQEQECVMTTAARLQSPTPPSLPPLPLRPAAPLPHNQQRQQRAVAAVGTTTPPWLSSDPVTSSAVIMLQQASCAPPPPPLLLQQIVPGSGGQPMQMQHHQPPEQQPQQAQCFLSAPTPADVYATAETAAVAATAVVAAAAMRAATASAAASGGPAANGALKLDTAAGFGIGSSSAAYYANVAGGGCSSSMGPILSHVASMHSATQLQHTLPCHQTYQQTQQQLEHEQWSQPSTQAGAAWGRQQQQQQQHPLRLNGFLRVHQEQLQYQLQSQQQLREVGCPLQQLYCPRSPPPEAALAGVPDAHRQHWQQHEAEALSYSRHAAAAAGAPTPIADSASGFQQYQQAVAAYVPAAATPVPVGPMAAAAALRAGSLPVMPLPPSCGGGRDDAGLAASQQWGARGAAGCILGSSFDSSTSTRGANTTARWPRLQQSPIPALGLQQPSQLAAASNGCAGSSGGGAAGGGMAVHYHSSNPSTPARAGNTPMHAATAAIEQHHLLQQQQQQQQRVLLDSNDTDAASASAFASSRYWRDCEVTTQAAATGGCSGGGTSSASGFGGAASFGGDSPAAGGGVGGWGLCGGGDVDMTNVSEAMVLEDDASFEAFLVNAFRDMLQPAPQQQPMQQQQQQQQQTQLP